MTFHSRLSDDGLTILLPSELARELGLRPGGGLAIELDGGVIKITPESEADAALARMRQAMKGYSVDQFLRERQSDWGG